MQVGDNLSIEKDWVGVSIRDLLTPQVHLYSSIEGEKGGEKVKRQTLLGTEDIIGEKMVLRPGNEWQNKALKQY